MDSAPAGHPPSPSTPHLDNRTLSSHHCSVATTSPSPSPPSHPHPHPHPPSMIGRASSFSTPPSDDEAHFSHDDDDEDGDFFFLSSEDRKPADDCLIGPPDLAFFQRDRRAIYRRPCTSIGNTKYLAEQEEKERFYPSQVIRPSRVTRLPRRHRPRRNVRGEAVAQSPGLAVAELEDEDLQRFVRHMEEELDYEEDLLDSDLQVESMETNLTVSQFVKQWFVRSRPDSKGIVSPGSPYTDISHEAVNIDSWQRPERITRPPNYAQGGQPYDIQGLSWSRLNVPRSLARRLRDNVYRAYLNFNTDERQCCQKPFATENQFIPKAMYTKYRGSLGHFQLRNTMSVTASNTVQYVAKDKVYSATPFYDTNNCVLDISAQPTSQLSSRPPHIISMKARHGVTVVGDREGTVTMTGSESTGVLVEQLAKNREMITHIDVITDRSNHLPRAVVTSNDKAMRIVDCQTGSLLQKHDFARAINCTDTSSDGRLRVVIGDAPDAWVLDSDTGKPIQYLNHHNDCGFACAWSPDMLHIATSNQDKSVNIWDTRMWRLLTSIRSDVAGYRSLRFSPVGGGPRSLLMVEPADRIALVNAQTYQTRQVVDFFGEIGGADFSPDGGRIWVSNLDPKFGGLMEYERCQWGQQYGLGHLMRSGIESCGDVYFPDQPNEWVEEGALDMDSRPVLGARERNLRFQRMLNGQEFAPRWRRM